MKSLTDPERKLIDRILADMTVRCRTDYLEYCRSGGYHTRSMNEIDLSVSLYRKGWITKPCDYFDLNPIWLNAAAWSRFALVWERLEGRPWERLGERLGERL